MPYRTPANRPNMQQLPKAPRIKYGVTEISRIMPGQWFPRAGCLIVRRAFSNAHVQSGRMDDVIDATLDKFLHWSGDFLAMAHELKDEDGFQGFQDHLEKELRSLKSGSRDDARILSKAIIRLSNALGCLWAWKGGPRLATMNPKDEMQRHGLQAIDSCIAANLVSDPEACAILYADAFRQLPILVSNLPRASRIPTDEAINAAIAIIQSGTSRDLLTEILGLPCDVELHLRQKGFL